MGLRHTDRFHPLEAGSDSPAAARPWRCGGSVLRDQAQVPCLPPVPELRVGATEALASSGLPGKAQTC